MTASRRLEEVLAESARQYGIHTAVAATRGASLTYEGLRDAAARGAANLGARGVGSGDRVLLHCESRPEWAAAFFAILMADAVAVPVPHDQPADAAVRHSGARAAVVGPRSPPAPGAIPIDALLKKGAPRRETARTCDLALLAFTSGSTAAPRAVALTHANLLADLDALRAVRTVAPGDAFLSVLPLPHLFELMGGLLGPLSCGARIVYAGAPLPNRIVDALREESITHAMTVPALLGALHTTLLEDIAPERRGQTIAETAHRLADAPGPEIRRKVRERIGDSLRTLVVGGAALDPAWGEIGARLGVGIEVGYGLTEASPIVTLGLMAECPRGSVGRPLPGIDVRIGDDKEILVRGGNVMHGYWRDPDATRATLFDGWLRTGDRGEIDDAGFLRVTGRMKELMVTAAGESIHPEEAEPHYGSPLFREWCAVPLRGDDGNDVPVLFVVPATPAASDEEIEREFARLRAAAPARLRLAKVLRLEGPLPRTALGKVRRLALAAGRKA